MVEGACMCSEFISMMNGFKRALYNKSPMKITSFAACLSCLLLTACMATGIVKSKLDVIEDAASCKAPVRVLIVLLPGAYDTPDDFVQQGFVTALRQRKVAADIVIADTHVGYYTSELLVTRLHEDIVVPARKKGYEKIWMVGISLGGYGSLLYAREHGADIDGLFLMAPFLGNRSLLAEIAHAGLSGWQAGDIPKADYDRLLWSWIKGYSDAAISSQANWPPLYIGYGTEDRFAGSSRIIEKVLPPGRVTTTDGGHEWLPWQHLWAGFLDRPLLPRCE